MNDSDSEGNDDWTPSDMQLKPQLSTAKIGRPEPARARRAQEAPSEPKRAIRLNVKPPSRLRQVTNEDDEESEEAAPAPRLSLSRTSKITKPPLIEKPSESEDEDIEEDDDDAEGSIEESEGSVDDDAAGDEDEDVDMSDGSPPPAVMPAPAPITNSSKGKIKLNNPYASASSKPSPKQVLKQGKVQSVEEKEIRMAGTGRDSDDDLSSIASDDANEGIMRDAEGDIDSAEDLDGAGDSDDAIRASQIGSDDLDSDDSGSPDPSKLTRRQRRASPSSLLALSNEAQKKKFFTAEQITMRRSEMARRRKDLSEKRNEQEKLDTLDRLLHKRAPVRRSRKEMEEMREREQFGTPGIGADSGDEGFVRPRAGYVRTIMDLRGTRVGVPGEWMGSAAGEVFMGAKGRDRALRPVNSAGDGRPRMVQEVA